MGTMKDILTGLEVNLIYDILKYLFLIIFVWGVSFLGYKKINKNIKIWKRSKIKKSFNSEVNEDIEIDKKVEIEGSFNTK